MGVFFAAGLWGKWVVGLCARKQTLKNRIFKVAELDNLIFFFLWFFYNNLTNQRSQWKSVEESRFQAWPWLLNSTWQPTIQPGNIIICGGAGAHEIRQGPFWYSLQIRYEAYLLENEKATHCWSSCCVNLHFESGLLRQALMGHPGRVELSDRINRSSRGWLHRWWGSAGADGASKWISSKWNSRVIIAWYGYCTFWHSHLFQ